MSDHIFVFYPFFRHLSVHRGDHANILGLLSSSSDNKNRSLMNAAAAMDDTFNSNTEFTRYLSFAMDF